MPTTSYDRVTGYSPLPATLLMNSPGDDAGPGNHLSIQPPSPRRLNVPRFDPEQTRTYLGYVMEPGSVHEMRVMGAKFGNGGFLVPAERFASTFAGCFDNIDAAVAEAGKLWGVSGYFMPNPDNPSLLARSANRITKQRTTATDGDVTEVRWVYVDIDAKRPAGISSTDEELAAAVSVRDRILAEEPELEAAAIWGISGNGAWVLVRIDPISPAESPALASKALAYLAAKYNVPGKVEIDPATRNPARIACLPGTLKCKGDEVPGRPHRLVTIDNAPGKALKPVTLTDWVAEHPAPVKANPGRVEPMASPGKPSLGPALRGADVTIRATTYLDKMAPSIQGQNGSAQCFDAACALTKGFGLTIEQALPLLQQWNARCVPPWSGAELLHKLKDASERPGPVGYLLNARPLPDFSAPSSGSRPAGGLPEADGEPDDAAGQEANPHRLARLVLDQFSHPDRARLIYWQGECQAWNGRHYAPMPDAELRPIVVRAMRLEFDRLHEREMERYEAQVEAAKEGPPPKRPRLRDVTAGLTRDVLAAIQELAHERFEDSPSQPAWLGGCHEWAPMDVLPAANALVHLPSYGKGGPCTIPPTPRFFSPFAVTYKFDPDAPQPREWLAFVESLWQDDQEAIECLQEWLGYLLTSDTSMQKILMVIGPRRSGKGTIARTLRELVGEPNIAAPTLTSLAGPFGSQQLIGKSVAVCTESRLSGRVDSQAIVERLLSVSGEDPQTIDRKHQAPWNGTLRTRFVLTGNSVPKLGDYSSALPSRVILLKLTNSFLGREDRGLERKLREELPGILLWSLKGWMRLKERGRFVQPKSGAAALEELEATSNPIGLFVAESCELDHDTFEFKERLFGAWLRWCEANGRKDAGNLQDFSSKLYSAFPEIGDTRPRIDGKRARVFSGIRLCDDCSTPF